MESSFSAIGKRAGAGGGVGNEALLRTDRKTRESVKKEDHFGGRGKRRKERGREEMTETSKEKGLKKVQATLETRPINILRVLRL